MHKPEVKAFVMALIVAGALVAQGVAITQPLDGLITSDINQRVTYVFAEPGAVDPASIVLNVDGTNYMVGSPRITWSIINLHYDVNPAWTEGLHELSITAEDTTTGGGGGGGDRGPIAGTPLATIFYVDATGPYQSARTPGAMGEAEPITTTNILQPITIDIVDDIGFINVASIAVMIDGTIYGNGDPGVTIDPIIDGYQFVFDPAGAGVVWPENYWVAVELLSAEDSPDYGMPNALQADPENAWGFWVDSDGPECTPVYPIPFFRPVAWIGCSDLQLQWHVIDENGINLSSFRIQINSMTYNWGNYRIRVDTLATNPYEWDEFGAPTAWYVTEALFRFTPNPYWYESVVYTIHPPYVEDIYGNVGTGWYWGAYPWTSWRIMFDRTGPAVSNPFPTSGYVTLDFEQPISFNVTDLYGGVDPTTLHMTIASPSMPTIEYTFWHPVAFPEITWDGLTFIYDPARAGIAWPQGDTITVTIWNIKDSTEFCDPNNMRHVPYIWTFFVADGPMVGEVIPGDDEFTACQNQIIGFELLDPDGIDPTTVLLEVEGIVFDITYQTLFIDTFWVGPIMIVDTTIVYPFYQASPGVFNLNTALLAPGIIDFADAMEINCRILYAEDNLGNPMWSGPYSWRFWIDYSGPYPGATYPVHGGVTAGPYPTFSMDIHDAVCGIVNPAGVNIRVAGINYNPLIHPGVDWDPFPGGGTITVRSDAVGVAWPHGATVNVCLTQAFDLPQYICNVWGNPGQDLPFCWNFTVDNNPPVATVIQPLNGEVSACGNLPIIIRVTDEYGVDPTYFQMIVNGIVINWGDPRLTWDGTFLTYTPITPYPEGVVEWSLARMGDIAGKVVDTSPISGWTFIADYSGPIVGWTSPAIGEIVTRVPEFFALGIVDPAGIDVAAVQFDVELYAPGEDVPTEVYNITEATHPGAILFDADLSELWLDLAAAGIDFAFEAWNVFIVVNGADLPDYVCPAANAMAPFQFDFSVDQGWHVDVEFYAGVYDPAEPPTDMYAFGAFVGGTPEYDAGLDILLPPPPPTETPISFITPVAGTPLKEDYQGLDTDSWNWTIWTGSQTGCIHWNPATLPALGSFVINDVIDMRGVDTYCFGPGEVVQINVTRRILALYRGWNLVSVPVIPDDPAIAAVFPMVNPLDVWEYGAGAYTHPEVAQPGRAYFVLYTPGPSDPDPIHYTIPGEPVGTYTRTINEGWATIGGVFDFGGVPVTSISTVPSGSISGDIVYYLNAATGGYMFDDKVVAGVGYWAYIDPPHPFGSAQITVNATYRVGAKADLGITEKPDWTLDINFEGPSARTLTIGGLEVATNGFDRGLDMLIPPPVPGSVFDVFIQSETRMAKDIRGNEEWTIVVTSIEPVNVNWKGTAPTGMVLEGMGLSYELDRDGDAVLYPGVYTAKRRVDIPTEFALRSASPNPFNAACAIAFDVPENIKVSVEVFDMLGRKVNTIVNTEFKAGTHRVIWDGTDEAGRQLSSGMYLYRMTAGSFSASGRMVYLR